LFLVVGLGNPGDKYKLTRHNAGFIAMDRIGTVFDINISKLKFQALISNKISYNDESVILVKPQTYMNLSGNSVREATNFYKIPSNNLIVVHDDIDIELGKIRIRAKGSSGGHNGIKNIIQCLDTENFIRIRIGIRDRRDDIDLADYVLRDFDRTQYELLFKSIDNIPDIVREIIKNGVDSAMNKFNSNIMKL